MFKILNWMTLGVRDQPTKSRGGCGVSTRGDKVAAPSHNTEPLHTPRAGASESQSVATMLFHQPTPSSAPEGAMCP